MNIKCQLIIFFTRIQFDKYHIPPCEAGLLSSLKFFISTSHQILPSIFKCGALHELVQCQPGLKAKPFVKCGSAFNHLFKGMICFLLMNNGESKPFFLNRSNLYAITSY